MDELPHIGFDWVGSELKACAEELPWGFHVTLCLISTSKFMITHIAFHAHGRNGLECHDLLQGAITSPRIVLDAFAGEGIAYGTSVQRRTWNVVGYTAGVARVDIHADDTQRG
jgi:hypothetical protein